MKTVELQGIKIPYNITKKKNKNTYFYFKKEGFIQVNLSRYQREQDAIRYIKQNEVAFIKKYSMIQQKEGLNKNYQLWGREFETIKSPSKEFVILPEKLYISYDPNNTDHLNSIKHFEQKQMMIKIDELHNKYQCQNIVSLDDVIYRTTYTKSRHGSCNKSSKTIRISTYLTRLDPVFTEYVYCHEIAHLKVFNHSRDFYNVLTQLLPNHNDIRQRLKKVW